MSLFECPCYRPLLGSVQLSETDAVSLDAICREYGVKLIVLRSYGLLGYLRVRGAYNNGCSGLLVCTCSLVALRRAPLC